MVSTRLVIAVVAAAVVLFAVSGAQAELSPNQCVDKSSDACAACRLLCSSSACDDNALTDNTSCKLDLVAGVCQCEAELNSGGIALVVSLVIAFIASICCCCYFCTCCPMYQRRMNSANNNMAAQVIVPPGGAGAPVPPPQQNTAGPVYGQQPGVYAQQPGVQYVDQYGNPVQVVAVTGEGH